MTTQTTRYIPGAHGGIPADVLVIVRQKVNVGSKRKPQIRVEVGYKGVSYWTDSDALVNA